jgi:hypothetical protein
VAAGRPLRRWWGRIVARRRWGRWAVSDGAADDSARGNATHDAGTYRAAETASVRIAWSKERDKANTRRTHKCDKRSPLLMQSVGCDANVDEQNSAKTLLASTCSQGAKLRK